MAVAYRSSSSLSLGTRTDSTLTAPSGITNGDVLLLILAAGAAAGVTVTPPTGFTVLTGFPSAMDKPADPWTTRLYVWYKVASSESGNYTATHSSASSQAYISAISGAAGTPINPNPTITNHPFSTGGATLIAPSITPVVNDSMVVWVGVVWDTVGATTPPTGTTPTFTERLNASSEGIYVADGILATAAATGDKSVSTANGNGQAWIAALICVEASVVSAINPRDLAHTSQHQLIMSM